MLNHVRTALRIILPVLVIAAGIGIAKKLVAMKKDGGKKPVAQQIAVVAVVHAKPVDRALTVRAQGQVMAARTLMVQPQLSGKILELHPALVPGGHVAEGDTLVRIEKVDYDLKVAQARTQLESAKQMLELERGRKVIADREWKLITKNRAGKASDAARARALREPQIRQAQAQVDAAKAGLRQARVNVKRAVVKAPFNGVVQQESVEIGQVVGPGAQMARLVGTDAFWVQVSVPVRELRWLKIPRTPGELGSVANVVHDTGDGAIERTGHIVRLLGDLDPVGRMARLVIEVPDPLGLKSGAQPLLLGAYVDVSFTGKALEDMLEAPRLALHEGDRLWFLEDGKLAIRPVTVARRLRDTVLISAGLKPDEQIIVTRLSTPVPGMALRRQGDVAKPDVAADQAKPGTPAGAH